jgi:hypothetical protein
VVYLEKLYQKYRDRVAFAFIYTAEAGHRISGYDFLLDGLPEAMGPGKERRERICRAVDKKQLSIPVFLDAPDGSVSSAYSAWPALLVVVGRDGRIARDFGQLPNSGWDWGDVGCVIESEIQASSVERPDQLKRWGARRPVEAGFLTATAVVFLVGFGLTVWQWPRAETMHGVDEGKTRAALQISPSTTDSRRKRVFAE